MDIATSLGLVAGAIVLVALIMMGGDLGMFLERISKFPRVINVGDMRVRGLEAQRARTTITVEVTATTFVLVEQPQPAAAPRPGGA